VPRPQGGSTSARPTVAQSQPYAGSENGVPRPAPRRVPICDYFFRPSPLVLGPLAIAENRRRILGLFAPTPQILSSYFGGIGMVTLASLRAIGVCHLFAAALVLISSTRGTPIAWAQTPAESTADAAAPPASIFCLRTEFFPGGYAETARPDRLAREIGRQAVLIAARDAVGLATRDDTLQEPFPKAIVDANRVMNAAPRAHRDGKLTLMVWIGSPNLNLARRGRGPGRPRGAPRPWHHETTFTATPYDNYLSMLARLEPMTRKEIPDVIRSFGFDGKVPAANPENKPPDSIDPLLLEMNFVSPYVAVRAAHAAIAKDGESPEWLGVLVHGYTNLSLTTQHLWTSQQEVFAARALLYAERLVNARPGDPLAHAHRAYARAIIGLHAAALAELKEIDALQTDADDAIELPSWVALLGPYCRFEREPVMKRAQENQRLAQLAQRLAFEQVRPYEDSRWLMDVAQPTIAVCPEAYGVYAALAGNQPLGVKRTGAYYGPAAMKRFLLPRLAAIPDLPPGIREVADAVPQAGRRAFAEPGEDHPFSPVAANIAAALISANDAGAGEPSWAVLGKLIEEEQFTQIANFFGVITDATETPLAELVDAVMPLIKDHRYAWYVKSFSIHPQADTKRFYEILGNVHFVDARGNMQRMFWRSWNANTGEGRSGRGYLGSWHAVVDSSLTMPGLHHALGQLSYYWWSRMSRDRLEQIINELAIVSPHSPLALRWKMSLVAEPTVDQLKEWEQGAWNDPNSLLSLGNSYSKQNDYDAAIRCYERSITLSGSYYAHVALAESYRASEREELWKPTLERFLKEPAFGLEHGWIHRKIANDFIEKKDWKGAAPHALRAAQTWSGWGLQLAAEVYEGLGEWEESEKWIRELAQSYPTSSALDWYFWCKRTGRGNVAAARQIALKVATPEWLASSGQGDMIQMVIALLDDEPESALPFAQKCVENVAELDASERLYSRMHLAVLAGELKQAEVQENTVAQIRALLEEEAESLSNPDVALTENAAFICDLLEGKDITEPAVADMLKQIDATSEDTRRNYSYLIGRVLELRGDGESADQFYRLTMGQAPFNKYCHNLAGHRLALRHGTSRP